MKITIYDHPYFGHGTMAKYTFDISEGLKKISYDKYEHKLIVEFDSCTDKMEIKVDDLRGIEIERP